MLAQDPERPAGVARVEATPGRRRDRQRRRRGRAAAGSRSGRGDQQRRRVGEGDVVGQPLRRHVAVRGDDRHPLYPLVESGRQPPDSWVGWEQAIGMRGERRGGHALIVTEPLRTNQRLPGVAGSPGCCGVGGAQLSAPGRSTRGRPADWAAAAGAGRPVPSGAGAPGAGPPPIPGWPAARRWWSARGDQLPVADVVETDHADVVRYPQTRVGDACWNPIASRSL